MSKLDESKQSLWASVRSNLLFSLYWQAGQYPDPTRLLEAFYLASGWSGVQSEGDVYDVQRLREAAGAVEEGEGTGSELREEESKEH